jgi:branched-chain amino acid transport system ATP-binding protein
MMLQLRNLTVRYGRAPAVQDLSLDVRQGEIVALLGANGAGKSTTLLSIIGALHPYQGEIMLDGQSLVGRKPEEIVRLGVGYVPEGRALFTRLTVAENLRLGLTVRKSSASRSEIAEMLSLFPALEDLLDTPAGKLSGGEQQQLALARSLLCRPRLLLLDEPTLGLAPILVDRVFETLANLRELGVTLLLVEQNARRSAQISDRLYVLHAGQLTYEGTGRALESDAELRKAYFGAPE